MGRDEYLHIDRSARLERGDTAAIFWDGRLAQVGRLARIVEDGKLHRCRMFGPHDEDVEIYRVLRRFVSRDI